jgi:gamma-glutamyl hydrolase
LHAQYVKFLEQGGAMVVSIDWNSTQSEVENLLGHINGVLFTGGALNFNDPNTGKPYPYTQTAINIFNKAMKLNDEGEVFPIWGTCMGFQLLMYLRYGSEDILNNTDAYNTSDTLLFRFKDQRSTKLFSEFPDDLIEAAKTEPLTANFHNYGVLLERFEDPASHLMDFYRLLATSIDRKGVEYIANVESIEYPFFGSQYHPEITEYTYAYNFTNHSPNAWEFAHHLALRFVEEAKKSDHKFDTYEELISRLVQTTGVDNMGIDSDDSFFDNYFFKVIKEKVLVSE